MGRNKASEADPTNSAAAPGASIAPLSDEARELVVKKLDLVRQIRDAQSKIAAIDIELNRTRVVVTCW